MVLRAHGITEILKKNTYLLCLIRVKIAPASDLSDKLYETRKNAAAKKIFTLERKIFSLERKLFFAARKR